MALQFKRKSTKRSGKNDCPGQLCLNISSDNSVHYLVERTEATDPDYAYWLACLDFLNKSGELARTWHLYQGIQKDPDLGMMVEMKAELDQKGLKDETLEAMIADARYHIYLMMVQHHCESAKGLYNKAEREWGEYKMSLHALVERAQRVGFNLAFADEGEQKAFLESFVILSKDGPCRREFYRKKVKTALRKIESAPKQVEPDGMVVYGAEAVSFEEIEEKFSADEAFKARFQKKRSCAKEKDRKNRGQRMEDDPIWNKIEGAEEPP